MTVGGGTCAGCTISNLNGAAGSVRIDPPADTTGALTLNYTVTDSGNPGALTSVAATITLNISGPTVWFVDNTNGLDTNKGTLGSPFKTLGKAATVDAASDGVFLYSGTYADGIALNTSEKLVGQATTGTTYDAIFGTPPTGTVTRPNLAGGAVTLQSTVSLASSAFLRGLALSTSTADALTGTGGLTSVDVTQTSITTTTGTALSLNNVAGTVTLTDLDKNGAGTGISLTTVGAAVTVPFGATIAATTVAAVDIDGGIGAFSYAGTISNAAGRTVEVTNRSTGSPGLVSFSGSVASTGGTGVNLDNNDNGTITFSGGLVLSTGGNPAFSATNGATAINVTGSGSTLTTTTGTALDVENTTIGASNLVFQSITANGGTHGIVLSTTGATGHLSVTGTGSAGTGGSITGITGSDAVTAACASPASIPTGVGIYLNSTSAPSFAYMTFPGTFGNFGILGYSVAGFTLDHSTMTGSYGNNDAQDEDTVHFCGLTGSATISDSTISNGFESNLRVVNASGTLNRLNLTNDTFGLNGTSLGGDGVLLEADGGTFNATVEDTTFQGSRGSPFQAVPQAGASMDLVFGQPGHGNTMHNTHSNIVPFAQDLNVAAGGTLTFDINSNHFDSASAVQAQGGVFINAANSTAVASGYFRNNTIGISGTANSGSSGDDPALDVESNGGGDLTIKVDNNQIYQFGAHGAGFLLQAGANAGSPVTFNATITNNTISEPGTFAVSSAAQGFQLNSGTNSGESFTSCLSFTGNSIATAGTGAGGDGRFRQRFDTKVRMPGYVGNTDGSDAAVNTGVVAYIAGLNSTGSPTITFVSSTAGTPAGGFFNTPGGAACALPGF